MKVNRTAVVKGTAQIPFKLHVRDFTLAIVLVVQLKKGIVLRRGLEASRIDAKNFVAHIAGSRRTSPVTRHMNVGGCQDSIHVVLPRRGSLDPVKMGILSVSMDRVRRRDVEDEVRNGSGCNGEEPQGGDPLHGIYWMRVFMSGRW